jgi:hypothetical protein
LELAKYAVEHRCDWHCRSIKQKPITVLEEDRLLRSPDDIRYFALLRAIVSGYQHVVHWLLPELGMDVGRVSELAHPELLPVDLAMAAGADKMLAFTLQMQADTEQEAYIKRCVPCQKTAVNTLGSYRNALFLREDYELKWRHIS